MKSAFAVLSVALPAVPAAAQSSLVPPPPQPLVQGTASAPSAAPVASPQSGMQTNGPSYADARGKVQPGNATKSTLAPRQAPGAQSGDIFHALGQ